MQSSIETESLPEFEDPGRVVILKSKWYPEMVDSMARKCVALLAAKGCTDVDVHTLPGSLEFPLAAADVLDADVAGEIEAIICLGIILKGDTAHFELISEECMRGVGWVMRTYRVPVIFEVLPVYDIAQAEARTADDGLNKGIEAAAAALELMAWRREVLGAVDEIEWEGED